MPAQASAIYLVEGSNPESAQARTLLEGSGQLFEVVGALTRAPSTASVTPSLITPRGTWFGIDEIKAYLSIPADLPATLSETSKKR